MKKLVFFIAAAIGAAVLMAPVVGAIVRPALLSPSNNINPARLAATAALHRNFSVAQHMAVLREIQSELHPLWRNLSLTQKVKRAAMWLARSMQQDTASVAVPAAFVGNQTVIVNTSGGVVGLQRQANCSLSLYNGVYSLSPTPSLQLSAPVPNYELILHDRAGLSTQPGGFAHGCVDPTLGIGSRRGAYLGKSTQGYAFMAGSGYDHLNSSNALFSGTVNLNSTAVQSVYASDLSYPDIDAIAAGDLNGDGLADVVARDVSSASIKIWLAHSDGTLGAPMAQALTGAAANTLTEAVVLADVNADGKVDVVVAACSLSGCTSNLGQEQIWIFTGKGDGTLNAPQHFDIPTPGYIPISNLIAADLRGTGHADLVGSNGLVLLNDGGGTFTLGSSAFVPGYANSSFGPNLVAGDFNNDGKLDLAVNNGTNIQLRMGNGDGTFTTGRSYASINDVGYLTATDLDGDGGTDLFVGLANGGAFGGDQFEVSQAYALMGNSDGTFQGATSEPFVYTGTNGADLNGDGKWDYVGVDAAGFTTYLGDGNGAFAAHATVAISPVTINGHSVPVTGDVDSYAVGDINGDGHADLAWIISRFTVQDATTLVFTPGIFVALGDGHGGLAAPTFYPVPTTLASPDFETAWEISNLHLADFDGDHKADLSYNYVASSYTTNNDIFGTVVQLGNGDATFQLPQVIPYYSRTSTGSTIGRTSKVQLIKDLNKDGIPDLIFLSQSATIDSNLSTYVATIQVALGVGDGTFSAPADVTGPAIMVAPFQNGSTATIAVSDMNGDGTPDILALGSSAIHNVQLAIALGNGNGTFKAPTITNYGAQYLNTQQGIATGDFNGDGKLDVAISDPYISTDSGVSLGNGDGTVQTVAGGSGALPSQSIALLISGSGESMDFNGDGKSDVLLGSTLLLGQGAASGTQSTTTTLTATPNPADAGQSVTLGAQVTWSSGGPPTGSVSFLDGSTVLGSDVVTAQGMATLTTSTLAAGTHSLTAHYAGDSLFSASTSAAVSLSVGATPLDFSISASPDSGSVAPGASADSTITLTPSNSSSGVVTLACSGLPAGATCTFTPSSVSLNGVAATASLTISTAAKMARTMASPPGRSRDPMLPTGLVLAGVFATGIVRSNHRRRLRASRAFAWISLLLVCAGAMALPGCGGGGGGSSSGGGTPSGTYTVTITGTSGSTSHAATYTLTVN